MIKIVVDSSCDISKIRMVYDSEGNRVQFEKAPMSIRVGEREFVDDENLDVAEMMKAMKEYDGATASSCPAPGAWLSSFEGADMVFVVTITSSLSGSYNSAMVAKDMMQEANPDCKILVIDSLSTGPEMSLLVDQILREIQAGNDFETICKNMEDYQKRTHLAFVLCSMDNLVKNGRVSKLVGFAASLLGISVVGRANRKGELEVISKGRGSNKVLSGVLQEMKQQGYEGGAVGITHCFNEKAALQMKDMIEREYPCAQVSILETRGLCSYYAEMGGILVGYEAEPREHSLAAILEERKNSAAADQTI